MDLLGDAGRRPLLEPAADRGAERALLAMRS
jgi:hypothetical protein